MSKTSFNISNDVLKVLRKLGLDPIPVVCVFLSIVERVLCCGLHIPLAVGPSAKHKTSVFQGAYKCPGQRSSVWCLEAPWHSWHLSWCLWSVCRKWARLGGVFGFWLAVLCFGRCFLHSTRIFTVWLKVWFSSHFVAGSISCGNHFVTTPTKLSQNSKRRIKKFRDPWPK